MNNLGKDTEEVFIVLSGEMSFFHFLEGDVLVRNGEFFFPPKGVEHKTPAKTE